MPRLLGLELDGLACPSSNLRLPHLQTVPQSDTSVGQLRLTPTNPFLILPPALNCPIVVSALLPFLGCFHQAGSGTVLYCACPRLKPSPLVRIRQLAHGGSKAGRS